MKQSNFTHILNNSKKRNYLEINQDILKCLEENPDNDLKGDLGGLSVTSLMYLSKITNSHTFYKKLNPLVGAGHVQQVGQSSYRITEKGKEYLKTLNMVLLPYNTSSKTSVNKKTYRKRQPDDK